LDVERAHHLGEDLAIAAAPERRVQVHEVDPLRAVALPLHRGVQRRTVRGLGSRLSLDEADGLPVGDIDGGQEFEVRSVAHGGQPSPSVPGRPSSPTAPVGSCPYSARMARSVIRLEVTPMAAMVTTMPTRAMIARPAGPTGITATATAVSPRHSTP